MENKTRLDDWSIVFSYQACYARPEVGVWHLQGKVRGHQEEKLNKSYVCTSRLIKIDLKERIAKTRNTEYHLGIPSHFWMKWLYENGYKMKDFEDCI